MNVTETGSEYRQLRIEDFLEAEPAEQVECPEVYTLEMITENNADITWKKKLMESILSPSNLKRAVKKVKSNRGAAGADGMEVEELEKYFEEHQEELVQSILSGRYRPKPVLRVEIPKEGTGKMRRLGIPTVVDRVIQQAIAQKLSPIYEKQFQETSYGFRPKRNAHDAVRKCREYIEEGYEYVVDMDLEKFFDTVCQSKMVEILSRTIVDGRVISLIHRYMSAGVIVGHSYETTETGVAQGGPLSPLLSNIMLNELDKELQKRNHKYVRYADDAVVFCKSLKSAERTYEKIVPYIEGKLFLKVNREKTKVCRYTEIKYLGYGFYHKRSRIRLHPETLKRMKRKIRELTKRKSPWTEEVRQEKLTEYIRGWINYFKLADMRSILERIDMWMRRRIRAIYLRRWKKPKTKYKMLRRLKVKESEARKLAYSSKKEWRIAFCQTIHQALGIKKLKRLGYPTFSSYYSKVCEN